MSTTEKSEAQLLQLSSRVQAPVPPYLREDVDERGDFIFHFEIPAGRDDELTLREFYRAHIHELLSIVRFHFRGRPVLVDAFSFLNDSTDVVPIRSDQDS